MEKESLPDKDHNLTQTRRNAIKLAVYGTTITTLGTTTVSAQTTDRSKWVFEVDENIRGGPTVVDNTVFFGADNSVLYAVDALTGERNWRFSTTGEIGNSSPAVVGDTVFVGSKVGKLYAVETETGEQQWSFEPTSAARDARFNTSPTVVDGTVFAGNTDYNLYAIDADTGKEEWSFEAGREIYSSPTVVDDTVFFGSMDQNLYAVDVKSGDQQWAFETGSNGSSSPTVADGTVFIGSYDRNLYAVDIETGEQEWAFETGDHVSSSSPTVADGTVFVGSSDNSLYAVDTKTGEQEWTFETDDYVSSSPTVVGDTVFVGSQDTSLYALDAETGTKLWDFETGNSVTDPIVVDGIVFVGTANSEFDGEDGNLYAINANVKCSSNGSRVNLGTLGHHERWNRRANPDDSISPEVELCNVNLTPAEVDGTNNTHILTFTVENLSTDDVNDDFKITLPGNIQVKNVDIVRSNGLEPTPSDPTPSNPIKFSVSPSAGDINNPPVEFEVELELSPNVN